MDDRTANEELNCYLLKAEGVSRRALNVMCFIGLFVCGWLLSMVFERLGKSRLGMLYIVPVIAIVVIARQSPVPIGHYALILYGIGWIHANRILSRYQELARARIVAIDEELAERPSADLLIHRGLLESKALGAKEQAVQSLSEALRFEGGTPQLLNLGGVALFSLQRPAEAMKLFERALAGSPSEPLRVQVQRNIASAAKKLGKSAARPAALARA